MPSAVKTPMYYGRQAWSPSAVIKAKNIIRSSGVRFDSFAVRGVSGLVFGSKLAHLMRKNLVVVRKPGETSHSTAMVEGLRPERYIFVDDFICSGATKTTVEESIRRRYPSAYMAGMYLYERERFTLTDYANYSWV